MIYAIKRGSTTIASVKCSGVQTKEILTQDDVLLTFNSTSALSFQRGDTVTVYGQVYELNEPDEIEVSNTIAGYSYRVKFEAKYYRLRNWILKTLDQNNQLRQHNVFLMASPAFVVDLVVRNANANDPDGGWEVGVVDSTEVMQFGFNSMNCLAVLSELSNKCNTEFWFDGTNGKRINLSIRQGSSGIVLKFGKSEGLYNVTRKKSDKPYFNRLIIEGGNRNLPIDYGFSNLQLPSSNRPWLEDESIENGVVEHKVTFDDIFPKRIGVVSALGSNLEIIDSSLDFDLNNYLTAEKAKIEFVSGKLAGFTFEISSYNHSSNLITFNLIDNDPAYPIGVPNTLLKAAVGDKYVLLDIEMPNSYLTAEENKLLDLGEELLEEGVKDKYEYNVLFTPKWILENSYVPELGTTINVVNSNLGINENLRVIGYTRDLQDGWNIVPKIGETAKVSNYFIEAVERLKTATAIKQNNLSDPQRARNNWRTTAELTTMLEALKAEMLLIMVDGSVFETNIFATVTEDNFVTTAGSLVNQQYEGTWSVSASSNTLASNVPYYVYVKASKSDSTATIVISATKIAVEEVSGFYHFMFGIISSKVSGTRVFTSTKGYTRIIGNNIQTGSIISINGRTYFDLDEGVIELAENAGISGNGTTSTSVRFWSGKSYSDRATAPFRVDHSGKLYASEAEISGKITAGVGSIIGGVEIGIDGKFNLIGTKVEVKPDEGVKVFGGGYADFTDSKMFIPHNLGSSRKVSIIAATDGSGGVIPPPPITSVTWGMITGSLSGQTDLMTALNGKVGTSGSGATGTWAISILGNAGTVTNGVYTTGAYANPSWLTAIANSKVTGLGTYALRSSGLAELSGATFTGEVNAPTFRASNFFRSTGDTGWFNETYSQFLQPISSDFLMLRGALNASFGIVLRGSANTNLGILFSDGNSFGLLNNQGGWAVKAYGGSSYGGELSGTWYVSGSLSVSNAILSGNGFQNTTYSAGRNRIWSFGNADAFGISYYQGMNVQFNNVDGIGFHFGDPSNPVFKFYYNGRLAAPTIEATTKLYIPHNLGSTRKVSISAAI